jgi:hypothetical protein
LNYSKLSNSSISIYNSFGIEIKRYEEKELTGQSSINFSTEEFPVGMNYWTFNTEKEKITKSFVVIR